MGLFDIFKSKARQTATSHTTQTVQNDALANFDCYYIYGLTDNPFRQSNDFKSFGELYKKVIGTKGGIVIGSSFHPYQLVNPKGTSAWQAGYVQLYLNNKKDEAFDAIINDNGLLLVDPSSAFKDIMIWPDTRLTNDENPIFSKYVPFVIPFLVYKPTEELNWDIEIALGMATKGNASDYVGQITNLTRFIMPEPSFILGFDKFDDTNPSRLIDNFMNCKKLLGQ
ncbi:hypothetical protein [Pedobacter namyangjuensis]|uniref:hypothetical protein n=1 Tax=Pedobacter namyangjuensis TaxID=600626 RepID=UPI0013B41B6A|nr:hypothetical protein [Pedobacter namyangjuensis]